MSIGPISIKQALDRIATYHRENRLAVNRASGEQSGIDIYSVSDPDWKRLFQSVFDECLRQDAEAYHRGTPGRDETEGPA